MFLEGVLNPSYTAFYIQCDLFGLWETSLDAWEGVDSKRNDQFRVVSVKFSAAVFLHYARTNHAPGVPMLSNRMYDDTKDRPTWRFYGELPLRVCDASTGKDMVLVRRIPTFFHYANAMCDNGDGTS
jgi:hypothetical protein